MLVYQRVPTILCTKSQAAEATNIPTSITSIYFRTHSNADKWGWFEETSYGKLKKKTWLLTLKQGGAGKSLTDVVVSRNMTAPTFHVDWPRGSGVENPPSIRWASTPGIPTFRWIQSHQSFDQLWTIVKQNDPHLSCRFRTNVKIKIVSSLAMILKKCVWITYGL